MTIYFKKDHDIKVTQTSIINFNGTSCTTTRNETHFILTSPYDECGIELYSRNNHIIFTALVHIDPNNTGSGIIEREHNLGIVQTFNCLFNDSRELTTGMRKSY